MGLLMPAPSSQLSSLTGLCLRMPEGKPQWAPESQPELPARGHVALQPTGQA